ncbi:PST family polysaccharide transporter [Caulobacter ginsengisoli]|uniref:PST family polysaccharide transporter n=1 Tax=Caulobacter ginsengisoli TaxID=400775 RepID=A0ABU0IM76_9CAUL|nr:oligosaccharide flippase family protein [Caulobacter ginsengisoli]MDQ0463113.1 PST family polysaccharide transporter [Caulobacter ginsengisoli]
MDEELPPPAMENPRLDVERTRKTVIWGVSLAAATKVGSIALSFVLARLIAPHMYGQYGTVSTILLFVMSFSMQRFTENLFTQKEPTLEQYHSQLGFGLLLHLLLFTITNLIALAMWFSPTFAPVAIYLHAASISILLNVPRIHYATHLRFELMFERIRMLQVVSFVLYAASSITLALNGFGIWALLTQNLVVPLPFVVAYLLDDKALRGMTFRWSAYRGAFGFGIKRMGGDVMRTAQQAIESVAFSALVGFSTLGIYVRAMGLAQFATIWLSDQVTAVLYPAVAKLEPRSPDAKRAAGLLLRVGLWAGAPAGVAVAMANHAAIHVLYGNQWLEAVPLVRPLLIAAVVSGLITMSNLVMLTNEGPLPVLVMDIVSAVVTLAGLGVLARWGIYPYVLYLAGAHLVLLAGLMGVLIQRGVILVRDMARATLPGLILMAAGLSIAAIPAYQQAEVTQPVLTLGLTGLGCGLTLLLLARFIDMEGLARICRLMPGSRYLFRLLRLDPRLAIRST